MAPGNGMGMGMFQNLDWDSHSIPFPSDWGMGWNGNGLHWNGRKWKCKKPFPFNSSPAMQVL